jgi:hypothetical protein
MPDSAVARLDKMTRFVRWEMTLEDGSTMIITMPAGAEDLDVTITKPDEG